MDNKELYKADFASSLSRIMKEKGITRTALAQAVGLSYPTIAAYLSGSADGKGVLPSAEKAIQISEVLGVSLDELFGRVTSTPQNGSASDAVANTSSLSEAQQQLKAIYTTAKSLNFSIELDAKTDEVTLKSDNHFIRMFFDRVEAGGDINDILAVFNGVLLYKGEIVDPITFQILKQGNYGNE